jgi:hypothetical protein
MACDASRDVLVIGLSTRLQKKPLQSMEVKSQRPWTRKYVSMGGTIRDVIIPSDSDSAVSMTSKANAEPLPKSDLSISASEERTPRDPGTSNITARA